MANPVNWTALQQRVDFIVDGTLGEPVILIPWVGANQTVYTPVEQGPDPNRKMVVTTGIFVTPGGKLVGESGRATGGGFNTQVLEQECWMSITQSNIGDVTNWVQYDRVYLPNRDRFYNLSYVEDSATNRPNIHLIREHDITTGEGSPLSQLAPTQTNALYFDTFSYKFYISTAPTGPLDSNGNPTYTTSNWVGL